MDDVDIVVDLQTGMISVLLKPDASGNRLELETASADDEFAPQE